MNILICDDETKYIELLKVYVSKYMDQHQLPYEITTVTSPLKICDNLSHYDLAFLDIQMEDMDGITFAKKLKTVNEKIAIFFVTNYDEFLDDAMDLHAFRFFSKPFDAERLYASLDKAMEYIDGCHVDVFLCGQSGQQQILVDDILYITRLNRKTLVVTSDGPREVSNSYDSLCQSMPDTFFYPVHKSFLINLHYIKRYSYSEVYLTGNIRIPVASRKQAEFRKFWFAYLRRR